MTELTNEKLEGADKATTSKGETLKFFGMPLTIAKFEFGSRPSLWSMVAPSKCVPTPASGETGMSRNCFDTLWRHMRWSHQPDVRPDGVLSERCQWMLVDDFAKNFNNHHLLTVLPSSLLCVDESISRWHGLGGEWTNIGLPMCVEIDLKPENGCATQNAACGKSGMMLRLRLVKTKVEEEANSTAEDDEGMLHGTKALSEPVDKWANTDGIVCADSHFASVPAAEAPLRIGLRFIGVVKTATKNRMEHLANKESGQCGDRAGVAMDGDDGIPRLLAHVGWMEIGDTSLHLRRHWRKERCVFGSAGGR